jgi:hypothetical protein
MIARLRIRITLALLAASLLLSLVATTAVAYVPWATRYHVGGPITLDTNLLSQSGVSALAIDEYLRAKTPLPPLGAAFLGAEKKYGVNARFLLAAALHESGWGTSYISRVKHNLFGYNAYDRNPFRYASAYATYAANIDATAKFIRDFYLRPGGRWWGGQPTLRSMQLCWSSSHSWGVNVSQIATSIHLAAIAGRSITVAPPIASGPLHGGSRTSIRLAWAGGAIPAGVVFVARWQPIELDADVVAAARAATVTSASPATLTPTPKAKAKDRGKPTSVAARRVRTAPRSITLQTAAPRASGRYLLSVEMLDSSHGRLPVAQRVSIPSVEVRVWGARAVSYEIEPSLDGTGVVVRITNTGTTVIPAASSQVPFEPSDPGAQRSVVSVTASASDASNPSAVLLIASPLRADMRPGASITVEVPGISMATGRATNWLSASLNVLGDATWLTASPPAGTWYSALGLSTTMPAGNAPTGGPPSSATPTPPGVPFPTTPTATPSPTTTPTPSPIATPAPTPKPTATPRPAKKPPAHAPARVTRGYSERSGAIRYRGAWGDAPFAGYNGGNVAWSRTPGASATFTFTGSSVSWIGPEGPTRGLALVLLDGRAIARIDLWRSSFVERAVLFSRAFHTTGRHTLTITVLSTPGHPYVAIDGFVVRS